MRIHLVAVGERMPSWVVDGFENYARRMPREASLELVEVRPGNRRRGANLDKARADEAQRLARAIPDGAHVVALDERGKQWSSRQLAGQLTDWRDSGRHVALLVGGADGLDADILKRADQRWSLSALTLPHALVRVVVAEQLYRAQAIASGHPYHRD